MRRLEETKSIRDRSYSGRPRLTIPNQDRKIRPTHIQHRFGSVARTTGTIYGQLNPRISAKMGLRRLRENCIRLRRAFVHPVRDKRMQLLQLQ